MKKTVLLISLLIIAVSMGNCEKDDICAENTLTTPSMVVEFFNAENTSVNRPVNNIMYFVEGVPDTIKIPGSVSEIRVPLQVNATSVKWGFIYSFTPTGATEPVLNTDFIEFNYTTQETYISRACGFKSNFYLDAVNPAILTDDTQDESNFWISEFDIEKYNIEDENETHISIYY